MVHLGPKKPPTRKGSFLDVPNDLMQQIKGFETIFTVNGDKLKAITKHFITELDKGLSKKGGNIPMIPAWVMDKSTGKEVGKYYACDLGGSNLRTVLITLNGDETFDTSQSKFKIPEGLRTTQNRDELFGFIADSLTTFYHEQFPDGVEEGVKIPLGFTFSYPASQDRITQGVLQRWTKGFDVPNVEGHDVVPLLEEQLKKRNTPIVTTALINDTVGTLMASLYTDPATVMGCIFGTGVNGAYFDVVKNIEKLDGRLSSDIGKDSLMAINCEYGSFDNEHLVLPRTKYDILIDEQSPRPGQQSFEKMTSGYYLGELLRLSLIEVYEQGFIFKGQDISKLKVPYIMDTSYPSRIEEDPFENLEDTDDLFSNDLKIKTTVAERKLIRRLSELIGTRAARLSVCGIAAVCQKRGYKTGHIAADGSVFNLYPDFKPRAHQGLRDIYDWTEKDDDKLPIIIVPAEDGSGAGAAIIAAVTEKRLAKGLSVGIPE